MVWYHVYYFEDLQRIYTKVSTKDRWCKVSNEDSDEACEGVTLPSNLKWKEEGNLCLGRVIKRQTGRGAHHKPKKNCNSSIVYRLCKVVRSIVFISSWALVCWQQRSTWSRWYQSTGISLSSRRVLISKNERYTHIYNHGKFSNLIFVLFCLFQKSSPGKNTWVFRRRSSSLQHYRIPHSNLAPKRESLTAAWRRTRSHPQPLDALDRSSPSHVGLKICWQRRLRR